MARASLVSVGTMVAAAGVQLVANAGAGFLATAWLPVSERGLMILMLAIAAITAMVATAGIGNTLRARSPTVSGTALDSLQQTYTRLAVYVVAGAAVLGAFASLLLVNVDDQLGTWPVVVAVAGASAAQVASTLLTDARFAQASFGVGVRWAAAAAAAGVVGLVAAAAACHFFGWALSAAILTSAQYSAFALVLVAATASAFRARALKWRSGRVSGATALLSAGVGTMILPLAITLITRSDRLILGAVTTAATVAVYGLATTYAEMLRIIPNAIGQLATSKVASGEGFASMARLGAASVVAAIGASAVMMVLVRWLTVPLFGAEYEDAIEMTLWLVPGEVFFALVVLCNLALIGGEWSRISVWIGAVSVPVAGGLFWWGSQVGGVQGVAIARDVIFMLMAVATTVALCVCLVRRRAGDLSGGDEREPPSQGNTAERAV